MVHSLTYTTETQITTESHVMPCEMHMCRNDLVD